MRTSIAVVGLGLLIALPAASQTASPAPAKTEAAPAYSTATTDLGTLLDTPAAKAVLEKQIPDLINNDQIQMARPMTLKALQQYAGAILTDEKLAAIDAGLATIPAKK